MCLDDPLTASVVDTTMTSPNMRCWLLRTRLKDSSRFMVSENVPFTCIPKAGTSEDKPPLVLFDAHV